MAVLGRFDGDVARSLIAYCVQELSRKRPAYDFVTRRGGPRPLGYIYRGWELPSVTETAELKRLLGESWEPPTTVPDTWPTSRADDEAYTQILRQAESDAWEIWFYLRFLPHVVDEKKATKELLRVLARIIRTNSPVLSGHIGPEALGILEKCFGTREKAKAWLAENNKSR
jgi:hypothetical protein